MDSALAVDELRRHFEDALISEVNFMGETTLEVGREHLKMILKFLKVKLDYAVLMDLTGVDYLEPIKRTKVLYWLHHPLLLQRLRIIVYVERDGILPSVVDLWKGADWYERELFDLFGINFDGHPAMKRLLMPDDWEGHPLRRDYALTEESVEFKHGVKPKVPSQIIPNVKGSKDNHLDDGTHVKQFNPFGSYVRSPEKH